MSPVVADSLRLADLFPPVPWTGLVLAIFLALVCGFASGLMYASFRERWAFAQARHGIQQAFRILMQRLEAVEECGRMIDQLTNRLLTPEQASQLEHRRESVFQQLARLATGQPLSPGKEPTAVVAVGSPPEWVTSPEDPRTGFPGKEAFEANFRYLLTWSRPRAVRSGLILIRADKLDQFRERHGGRATEQMLHKLGLLICRQVRDCDLVCHATTDTFGILLPAIDGGAGERIAAALRDHLRTFQFRVSEKGPDVLVTASLGWTPCTGDDAPELAFSRALEAVDRSQRVGRNQLHVHDGRNLMHCTAS